MGSGPLSWVAGATTVGNIVDGLAYIIIEKGSRKFRKIQKKIT
jgi:hypothetical protein